MMLTSRGHRKPLSCSRHRVSSPGDVAAAAAPAPAPAAAPATAAEGPSPCCRDTTTQAGPNAAAIADEANGLPAGNLVLLLLLQLIRACIMALACSIGWKVVCFHTPEQASGVSLLLLLLRLLQLQLLDLLLQPLQWGFARCKSLCGFFSFCGTQQQHQLTQQLLQQWQQVKQQVESQLQELQQQQHEQQQQQQQQHVQQQQQQAQQHEKKL
ncbi:hypothetical protein Efla_007889 [Eimeria flavescens]